MADYAPFKDMFRGVTLDLEDLYLLESFQIEILPGITDPELAAVLHAFPSIKRFLLTRCPGVSASIERIMKKYSPAKNDRELKKISDKLVWSIADWLVYGKCPQAYDNLDFHRWDFREVTVITPLDGKIVIDGGAGTGRVTLEAARTAGRVHAVEPVARLRQFIRDKAFEADLRNIFVTDGFLHAIPLPDNYADVLITSHALGWHLEKELKEFERVVRKGGYIIHCPGTAEVPGEEAQHYRLISPDWGYDFSRYAESDGWKRKYWKRL
jgi:ubiquinone/menaquinone biosynthesis C-methylase UbiE